MTRLSVSVLALGAVLLYVVSAPSQPPGKDRGPNPGNDPRRGPGGQPPFGPPGGPPPFEAGRVLPPHLRDQLRLTQDQEKQVAELEKEVKDRLMKILTTEQKKKLEEMRQRGPRGGPFPPRDDDNPRRPDGPPRDRPGRGDDNKRPDGPPPGRGDDRDR